MPEQQYFSDGITEDIITELSRSRSLFVIARNSSFQYRDKAVDVRRIARDLGVRYVVEGSVRKMGSRIRITAQLIDAVPGNHLWSERFDRGIEELFEVQDELTQTIVATVAGRLEDAEIRLASNKRTDSLPAYDCLLRGIQHLRGYGPTTTDLRANCSSRPWPSIRATRWPMPTLPCRCWSKIATAARPMPSSNVHWTLPRLRSVWTRAKADVTRSSGRSTDFVTSTIWQYRTLNAVWSSTPTMPSAWSIWPRCSASPAAPKRASNSSIGPSGSIPM